MQTQAVKRIVDASKSQGRVIVHLECGHNLSITPEAWEHLRQPGVPIPALWQCPHCPDAPAEADLRQAAFNQVWRGDE